MAVDLELATTEQIVEELARRYQGILLAHIGGVKSGDQEAFSFWYRGGFTLVCGLAHRCATDLDADSCGRMKRVVDEESEEQ